jgi:hypothetical protein
LTLLGSKGMSGHPRSQVRPEGATHSTSPGWRSAWRRRPRRAPASPRPPLQYLSPPEPAHPHQSHARRPAIRTPVLYFILYHLSFSLSSPLVTVASPLCHRWKRTNPSVNRALSPCHRCFAPGCAHTLFRASFLSSQSCSLTSILPPYLVERLEACDCGLWTVDFPHPATDNRAKPRL